MIVCCHSLGNFPGGEILDLDRGVGALELVDLGLGVSSHFELTETLSWSLGYGEEQEIGRV